RSARPNTKRPNEAEAASAVRNLGRTNPRRSGATITISPNEPETRLASERHFGQMNPSPQRPTHTLAAKRTQATDAAGEAAVTPERTQDEARRRGRCE